MGFGTYAIAVQEQPTILMYGSRPKNSMTLTLTKEENDRMK